MVKPEYKKKVDDFIHKLYDTKEIWVEPFSEHTALTDPRNRAGQHKTIIEGLTDELYRYRTGYGSENETIEYCLYWIEKAEAYDVIEDSYRVQLEKESVEKGKRVAELEQKVADLEREYNALSEEHQKIREDNIGWQIKYKECNDKFRQLANVFKGVGKITK